METCVRAGGGISGEHGVGLDKRDFTADLSDDDMEAMLRVRAADPLGLCNPARSFPCSVAAAEARAVAGWGDGEMGKTGLTERAGLSAREAGKTSTSRHSSIRRCRKTAISDCRRSSINEFPLFPFSPSPFSLSPVSFGCTRFNSRSLRGNEIAQ
jgi:hypothetical protein